jgi:putative cardiolipin synthase
MLIDSPELAEQVAAKLDASFAPANCYQLDLRGKQMIWQGVRDGKPEIWTSDPEVSGWRSFKCGVLGLLPIENEL